MAPNVKQTRGPGLRRYFKLFSLFIALTLSLIVFWVYRLNTQIDERLRSGWFRPPVELFARGETFRKNSFWALDELRNTFVQHQYRERASNQALYPGDFSILARAECAEQIHDSFGADIENCVSFSNRHTSQNKHFLLALNRQNQIAHIFTENVSQETDYAALDPELYAQFFDGEPILRTLIHVGDTPLECLQATTAIEDKDFLEHRGVSASGFLRAMGRNLLAGRYAQGGSTITQQLVKNYFLTSEKTIRRKIQEMVMAVLLESKLDKDQILENYLNVNYMGQRGPFQVIGFGAAAEHYVGKKLSDLNLSECALLAAIINNPGRFDPAAHPENAKKRRGLVLSRMLENKMISPEQANRAQAAELPVIKDRLLREPAPYFTQAIFRELSELGLSTDDGLKIYTTLDMRAQDEAQIKTLAHVQSLESNHPKIAKIKTSGKSLEASILSVDVRTGEVMALVGGRQYVKTQFNRVLDAHRQVGSIMKPFVFLAALEGHDARAERLNPLTKIDDLPFVYEYEGQKWAPQNYTKEYNGSVPLYYALKMSLNAATAKLGLQTGLNNVIDVARRAGIAKSEMKSYPALTLGAFEIYPWEVATAYLTLARLGNRIPLQFIRTIESADGNPIYVNSPSAEQVFSPETTATLVSMMKQTLTTGTARLATLSGFSRPAAGKTGTTSDLKDTWFAGFTPQILTITWTGYDDNTPTTLTGATGALPLWIEFMKSASARESTDDFPWPKDMQKIKVSRDQIPTLISHPAPYEIENPPEFVQ